MNNVIDEVLAGNPKYTLTYSDNTVATGVSIDLETEVTTQGTPLNKALFDSIKDDLNSRLLKSSIASPSEATEGTNNEHYMTPLRNQQHFDSKKATTQDVLAGTDNTKFVTPYALNALITTQTKIYTSSQTTVQTDTIYTFNNNTNRISVNGWVRGYATTGAGYATPERRSNNHVC